MPVKKYGSEAVHSTKDDSPAAVLVRHYRKFISSQSVNGGEWFDLAWEAAQRDGATPTNFLVALLESYLREKRRDLTR